MTQHPCSGLTTIGPACEHRRQCVNYRHWGDDPRAEFNLCKGTLKYFVPRDTPAGPSTPAPQRGQASLF